MPLKKHAEMPYLIFFHDAVFLAWPTFFPPTKNEVFFCHNYSVPSFYVLKVSVNFCPTTFFHGKKVNFLSQYLTWV